jgi:glycosyltransferase involved in cell wall biosynthesis
MDNIYLSIVIPCYNEERNIRLGALENVTQYLLKKKYSYEVILIDDGSGDESKKLINAFITGHKKFKLFSRQHQGKAAAVIAGMSKAKGRYILFTDLDQATPINQLDILMPFFDSGFDVVIGSRNTVRRGAPLMRQAMARGFIFLRNLILNLGIKDTQCGFKIFSKKAIYNIISRLKVHHQGRIAHGSTVTAGFDVEVLYIAKLLGFKIAEVPVEWHYQETRHINPLKDSWEGLIDLFKIRLNTTRGVYKKNNAK